VKKSKLGFQQIAHTQLSFTDESTVLELFNLMKSLHNEPYAIVPNSARKAYRRRLKDFMFTILHFNLDWVDYQELLKTPYTQIDTARPKEADIPERKMPKLDIKEEDGEYSEGSYNYVGERLEEIDLEVYRFFNQLSSEIENLKGVATEPTDINKINTIHKNYLPLSYQRYEGIVVLSGTQMQALIDRLSYKYPELKSFQKKAKK
jgi:hypothetical protein